ncbi:MAG: N-acetylmuramoyl-L-alanine amidase [Limnochordia bacterium]
MRSFRLLAALILLLSISFSCRAAGIELFVGTNQKPVLPQPIVSGGNVFVPANVIGSLGGQVDQLSESVLRFRLGTRTVTVEAGKATASVDDRGMQMGGTALSRQNILFLPLLFVSELLDLGVSWEQGDEVVRLLHKALPAPLPIPSPDRAPSDTSRQPAPPIPVPEPATETMSHTWQAQNGTQLEAVAWLEHEQTVLELTGIGFDSLESWVLEAPARLVIDTTAFLPDVGATPWILSHPWVKQVRVAPFKGKGRIVLDLHDPVGYQIEATADGVRVRVNRGLRAVDFAPSVAGGSLRLGLPAQAAYQMTKLVAPERIVIDLQGTTLLGGARHLPVTGPFVSAVRASQFDQQTVRIVLDLVDSLPELPLQVPGSRLEFVLRSEVSGVSLVSLADGRVVVVVEGKGSLNAQIMRLRDPERVVLDIANAWPTATFGQAAGIGQVRALRAGQFSPQVYRVVAELSTKATVRSVRFSQEAVGVIIEPASLAGVRVAVDAGHGGADPGAIGRVLGVREADVNLDIAQRLLALLGEAEAEALMVRPDERLVLLADRPQLVAQHNSEIFVSIHCNSAQQSEASGTETLYSNSDNGSIELARSLQAELVKTLGTKDRGVKQVQLLVLRASQVPAALVEIAFLSHSEEEQNLANEDFRQKAAQGIYNGLLRFVAEDAALPQAESRALWQRLQEIPERIYLPTTNVGVSSTLALRLENQGPGHSKPEPDV